MKAAELAVECVAAADELLERRVWERFDNEDLLVFDLPERDLVLGSIMGAGGEEHGLVLMVGPQALDDFDSMTGDADPRHSAWTSTMLAVSFERRADIEPPFDRVLERAGKTGRTAPLFLVKQPGQHPQPPRAADLETLLYAIRGLLTADATGRLRPEGSAASGILPLLRITGSPRRPDVRIELADLSAGRGPLELAEIEVPSGLAVLPRVDTTYLIGFTVLPVILNDAPGEARALAIVDGRSGEARALEIVDGFDLEAAADRLFAVLRGEGEAASPGLPQQLVFASEPLFGVLQRGFGALGVACSFEEHLPQLDDMLDELENRLGIDSLDEPFDGFDPDHVPDPDDLAGWKEVDLRVTNRLAEAAVDRAMESNKAWRRYFGRPRAETVLERGERGVMIVGAYLDWYTLTYRATKRSQTVAARLLDGELPAAERAALAARADARVSFYRVTGVTRGDSVELLDVLSGRAYLVTDRSISMSVHERMVIIARAFPVGAFYFAMISGPPLLALNVEPALAFLQSKHRLHATDTIDPSAAHLLGRLWEWADENAGIGDVTLTNTDGDELLWHTASFGVADPAALIEVLDGRDDLSLIDAGAEWSWQRGDLHLGKLNLYGDELLLEVNSAERLDAARAWLEAISGVTFASVNIKNVDPRLPDDSPLDDRLPSPPPEAMTPEVVEQVQALFDAQCMGWLDESIPALGGETPRQVCVTEEGRRRVTRMIRTYADPTGTPRLTVPRAAMLAELGLDAGEASAGA